MRMEKFCLATIGICVFWCAASVAHFLFFRRTKMKTTKTAYEVCEIEIINFDDADVITTSPTNDNDENQGDWM